MKFKKILLVATALIATACGPKEENTNSNETNSNVVGENTNNENSNTENNNGENSGNNQGENTGTNEGETNSNNGEGENTNNESTNNESTEKPNEYPSIVANSKWGIEAANACYSSIGTVIPFMESDSFDYNEVIDDFGDAAIWFYLYYETSEIAESKITDYAYVCYEADQYECVVKPYRYFDQNTFSYWDQTTLFADKVFTKDKAVEIVAIDSIYNGKPCLGIYCINYIPNINKNAFPTNAVENLLGKDNDLPTLSTVNDELTYSFTFFMESGLKCLEIVVEPESAYFTLEEAYFYELLRAAYRVFQYDDLEDSFTGNNYFGWANVVYPEFEDNIFYYALSPEEDYMVAFDFDLNQNVFVIDIIPYVPE